MTIHERLKAERERLHLSQPSLAERAGVGKTTVINWEKGASAPDAVQLAALATAGADVLYILTGRRSHHYQRRRCRLLRGILRRKSRYWREKLICAWRGIATYCAIPKGPITRRL